MFRLLLLLLATTHSRKLSIKGGEKMAAKFWASRDHQWTTIAPDATENESVVNTEDFKHVPRCGTHKAQHLDQTSEDAPGAVRANQVIHNSHFEEDRKELPVERKRTVGVLGRWIGVQFFDEWLDRTFERGVCGYREEDTFSRIMNRYNGSLRGAIEYQLMKKKRAIFARQGMVGLFVLLLYCEAAVTQADIIPLWLDLLLYSTLFLAFCLFLFSVVPALFYWCVGRPFPDENVLIMMVQIALGMHALHAKGKVHHDLRAENVFVKCDKATRLPVAAYVRESELVAGTSFWRAPEVVEGMKEGRSFRFGPEADVYSYGMTCYEILLGWIPPGILGWPQYKVDTLFTAHWRPQFPMFLNPKVKDLIERCWHHDPAMRPTFPAIVAEWEALVDELVTESQDMSKLFKDMFDRAKTSLDVERAGVDSNLVKLRKLLQELVAKYDGADFVVVGLEVVAAMEEFQTRFASPLSFAERHEDPDWFASRRKLRDAILRKRGAFARTAARVAELGTIGALMESIIHTIDKDNFSDEAEIESFEKPGDDGRFETLAGDAAKVWYNLYLGTDGSGYR